MAETRIEPEQMGLPFLRKTELLPVDFIYEQVDQELLDRLRSEDRRYERKSAGIQAQLLGDYLSILANSPPDGGLIAIGVDDDGSYSGCAGVHAKHLNDLERTGDVYCPDARYEYKRVPIRNKRGDEDFVLLFRVQYRSDKVVETVRGEAWIRRGESKKKLTDDEKRELRIAKHEIDFEQEQCGLKYPEDFDLDLVHKFAENCRLAGNITNPDDAEILEARRLGRIQNSQFTPNLACAAVFAKDPCSIIPGCKVRILRFDGTQEGTGAKFNAVKDFVLEGNVPGLIEDAEDAIESQIRDFTRLGADGRFFTAPEYPKEAWLEAIVNACVHRSYNLKNMNIFVKMFDDRLEIESPGGFPPLVTPENIYDMHEPRNPKLMDALFHLRLVQCAHEGTRRMRDTMREMGLPAPEFVQQEVGGIIVRVTLRNNIAARKIFVDSDAAKLIGEAIFRTLTEDERQIINYLAENEFVNVSDAQRLLGRSWPYTKKLLMRMTKRSILIHVHNKKDRDQRAYFGLMPRVPRLTRKETSRR
jgi:ATP-dependent DNA helicase RecG